MRELERFNDKYAYLGGWTEVMSQRAQGRTWVQIASYFHLSPNHLVRLSNKFSKMDSLSRGEHV